MKSQTEKIIGMILLGVIVFGLITLILIIPFAIAHADFTGTQITVILGLAAAVWFGLLKWSLPHFTMKLEPLVGRLTVNSLTGTEYWYDEAREYLVWPWETQGFDIPLIQTNITSGKDPLDNEVEAEILETLDGYVSAEFGLNFEPNIDGADEKERVDKAKEYKKLDDPGRAAVLKEKISEVLSVLKNKSTADASGSEVVMTKALEDYFNDSTEGKTLLKSYGVKVKSPRVFAINTPPEILEARGQNAANEQMHASIRKFHGLKPDDKITAGQIKLALIAMGKIKATQIYGVEGATMVGIGANVLGDDKPQKGGKQ